MSRSPLWVPERAEIIYIDLEPQSGPAMPDAHRMLVVSERAFADRTGLVVGFPITASPQHADNPFAIEVVPVLWTSDYVLVHQVRSADWRVRGARPCPNGTGRAKLLATALKRFDSIFSVCSH